jgi:hypothetical protein
VYEKQPLIWSALLMFAMGLGSRRQFDHDAEDDRCGALAANLNRLAGAQAEDIPHNQTVADYLSLLPPQELELIPTAMVGRLVRMRVLDSARLFGLHLIAIDATGTGSSPRPCCKSCLRQEQDGKSVYYHMVLEAKLVTPDGLALSVASEFIENTDRERHQAGLRTQGRRAADEEAKGASAAAADLSALRCAPRKPDRLRPVRGV